jgi:hypothetical protein
MMETYDFSKGKRGPVIAPTESEKSGTVKTTIHLDEDILDFFLQEQMNLRAKYGSIR